MQEENTLRYIRQTQVNFIPNNIQEIIKNKKLVIIGCGGVGSPLAELLIRGGFECITLIDFDRIDQSNLNRQIFFEKDVGKYKSSQLKLYLKKINSNINIKVYKIKINEYNINQIRELSESDLIIDATDNFKIRHIINDFTIKHKKDWLYNGAIKGEVITSLFYYQNNKFNNIFRKDTKDEKASLSGILPSTTFFAASVAYNQILKYFIGIKENTIIKYDIWNNKIHEINI